MRVPVHLALGQAATVIRAQDQKMLLDVIPQNYFAVAYGAGDLAKNVLKVGDLLIQSTKYFKDGVERDASWVSEVSGETADRFTTRLVAATVDPADLIIVGISKDAKLPATGLAIRRKAAEGKVAEEVRPEAEDKAKVTDVQDHFPMGLMVLGIILVGVGLIIWRSRSIGEARR